MGIRNPVIDVNNWIARDAVTLVAGGPEAAGMLAANLKTEEPGRLARITTLDPLKTYWEADLKKKALPYSVWVAITA